MSECKERVVSHEIHDGKLLIHQPGEWSDGSAFIFGDPVEVKR